MKLLLFLVLPAFLCGCTYRASTYRSSSPLRSTIGRSDSPVVLRAGILAVIPLGTPRTQVEETIRANFHTRIRSGTMPVFRLKTAVHSGASFIYIRLYDHVVGLSGSDGANAQFFFDRNDKLQDIQIFQFGGYL